MQHIHAVLDRRPARGPSRMHGRSPRAIRRDGGEYTERKESERPPRSQARAGKRAGIRRSRRQPVWSPECGADPARPSHIREADEHKELTRDDGRMLQDSTQLAAETSTHQTHTGARHSFDQPPHPFWEVGVDDTSSHCVPSKQQRCSYTLPTQERGNARAPRGMRDGTTLDRQRFECGAEPSCRGYRS